MTAKARRGRGGTGAGARARPPRVATGRRAPPGAGHPGEGRRCRACLHLPGPSSSPASGAPFLYLVTSPGPSRAAPRTSSPAHGHSRGGTGAPTRGELSRPPHQARPPQRASSAEGSARLASAGLVEAGAGREAGPGRGRGRSGRQPRVGGRKASGGGRRSPRARTASRDPARLNRRRGGLDRWAPSPPSNCGRPPRRPGIALKGSGSGPAGVTYDPRNRESMRAELTSPPRVLLICDRTPKGSFGVSPADRRWL